MKPANYIPQNIIYVLNILFLSLSFPLDVKVSNILLNIAIMVTPETITPTEKLPFKGYIDSQLYSIKTGTIGIRKNPKRNYYMHNGISSSIIKIGYMSIVNANDIINKVIPIALYFLNFNTNLDTNPADKNPPMINIDEAIE